MWCAATWVRRGERAVRTPYSPLAGNRAATFPSQLLGWDTDVVNTVQFSNHTGYRRWGGMRMDEAHLEDLFAHMDMNGVLPHARVLTGTPHARSGQDTADPPGYTPSPGALATVKRLIERLRSENADLVYLLDPVMGDMSRGMYVNPEVLPIYRSMLPLATIICPNQFEAQQLAGQEITSLRTLQEVLQRLHSHYGARHIVITSVELPDADLRTIGASRTLPDGRPAMVLVGSSCEARDAALKPWFLQFPELGDYFVGVGDLFSALTLARFAERPEELPAQARTAAERVAPASPEECALPIARAAALAVASVQGVLHRTLNEMHAGAAAAGVDPLQSTADAPLEENVAVMRLRELRIVQSAGEILAPEVVHRPRWMPRV